MEASVAESLQGEGTSEAQHSHWDRHIAGGYHQGGQTECWSCMPRWKLTLSMDANQVEVFPVPRSTYKQPNGTQLLEYPSLL